MSSGAYHSPSGPRMASLGLFFPRCRFLSDTLPLPLLFLGVCGQLSAAPPRTYRKHTQANYIIFPCVWAFVRRTGASILYFFVQVGGQLPYQRSP